MKKLTKEELSNVSGGGHWKSVECGGDGMLYHKWVWIKDNPDEPDRPDRSDEEMIRASLDEYFKDHS